MIIDQDRADLDQALSDEDITAILLYGTTESTAGKVHDYIVNTGGLLEDWHRCFLLTDLSILTEPEKSEWIEEETVNRYAVVGGAGEPKPRVQEGPVDDLLLSDGQPDNFKIYEILNEGD